MAGKTKQTARMDSPMVYLWIAKLATRASV
jgi:hypothetical protein